MFTPKEWGIILNALQEYEEQRIDKDVTSIREKVQKFVEQYWDNQIERVIDEAFRKHDNSGCGCGSEK